MNVIANGVRIHYTVEGEGPWLAMSHSLACDLHMWDAQAAALRGRYRVLRFDTRGHGRSDPPPGVWRIEDLAADLDGLLNALGIERCAFVGLSMGGMIAMTHALLHPGRLERLVLCNTTSRIPPEAQPVWQQRMDTVAAMGMEPMVQPTLERWFTAGFRTRCPEVIAAVARMIRATPPAGYLGCGAAIRALDLTSRLSAIAVPTLVIGGDQDAGTPVEAARAIQLAIPGAQLAVIPSAAHLSNLEQPELFGQLVARFLDGV